MLVAAAVALVGLPGVASASEVELVATVVDEGGRPEFVPVTAPTAAQARDEAEELDGFVSATRDTVVRISSTDDRLRGYQGALTRLRVDAVPEAPGSATATVAVVDTGVAPHPDVAPGTLRCDLGVDLVGDGRSTNGCVDPHGHGTHVAGIVGATRGNGTGIHGFSNRIQLIPVRVLGASGSGDSSAVATGIVKAADAGADVINLSLGGPDNDMFAEAVAYARSKGAVVVAAAGNGALDGNPVEYPAATPGVVSVGAIDDVTDAAADFSTHNAHVDLAAPGVQVVSTYRDGGYVLMSGTSQAAPHVAGSAALYRLAYPDSSESQVVDALVATATDLGAAGRDDRTGAGLVHPYVAVTGNQPPAQQPPTTPTALTTEGAPGEVALTWDRLGTSDARPVELYRVFRDGQPYRLLDQQTDRRVTFIDEALEGETHRYAVAAINDIGESAPSPEVSGTALLTPVPPTGLTGVVSGPGTVTLSWDRVGPTDLMPVQQYWVERDGVRVASAPIGDQVRVSLQVGAGDGREHRYAVRTWGAYAPQPSDPSASVALTAPLLPAAPGPLSATAGDGRVALSWTPAPSSADAPVTGYRLVRDGQPLATLPAHASSHVDSGLVNGRAYAYSLVAEGPAGTSASASTASATPVAPPPPVHQQPVVQQPVVQQPVVQQPVVQQPVVQQPVVQQPVVSQPVAPAPAPPPAAVPAPVAPAPVAPAPTTPAPAPVPTTPVAVPRPVAQPSPARPSPTPAPVVRPVVRLVVPKALLARQRMPLSTTGLRPGSVVQVTDRYQVVQRVRVGRRVVTRRVLKVVQLPPLRADSRGTLRAAVLPVQAKGTHRLLVTTTDRAGRRGVSANVLVTLR